MESKLLSMLMLRELPSASVFIPTVAIPALTADNLALARISK